MKINELRSIIREVIAEEIANESANKKQLAINEIKRIISENELTAEDLNEIDFKKVFKKVADTFKPKPATDEELDAYLSRNSKLKNFIAKMDPEKAKKWREFVKIEKADRIKKDEAILNVRWNGTDWEEGSGPSGGGGFNT
jgi:vacuolar-type H+-ATPase catalytic subunit A/Vma1